MAPREKVFTEIDRNWDEQVAFLQKIVRMPSELLHEAPVQHEMLRSFRGLGLETDSFDADPGEIHHLPGYSPVEWGFHGRPQVVGVWRSPDGTGRSLVLNGHVDVVSPEPVRLWSRDPWGAEIAGGRMYGRGALDMKAGMSAIVYATKAMRDAGVTLGGDIILQSVIEEECTGNGTLACLARGYVGDGALIPEPEMEWVLAGEIGVLWLRSVVTGAAGHVHGATMHVNAIEKAYVLITALRDLEAAWNSDPHPAYRGVNHPINFNPGVITGGDWPSTVPAECVFTTRISFYPGISPQEAKGLVLGHLEDAINRDPWLREHRPLVRPPRRGFHRARGRPHGADGPAGARVRGGQRDLLLRRHGRDRCALLAALPRQAGNLLRSDRCECPRGGRVGGPREPAPHDQGARGGGDGLVRRALIKRGGGEQDTKRD